MSIHDSRLTTHGFFVTGTDTGVGKTLIACALLKAFAARGLRAVGMKPVASGAETGVNGLINDDVERLLSCGNVAALRQEVNPYCFAPPIAPHIAARQAGVAISLERIEHSYRALAARAEVVVAEGVGGFLVPLGPAADTAQLAERLGLPIVLVVGMRLGCLNHALLTVNAISARGLKFAGWVANHVDPEMAEADANVAALEERIAAPLLARIAFVAQPDPAAIAILLDSANLL